MVGGETHTVIGLPLVTRTHPIDAAPRRLHEGVSAEALVAGLRGSEPWAWAELYLRHGPGVRRVLARILGLGPEVDDLTQEVFLRAKAAIDKLRRAESLQGWLHQIAVFKARHLLRSRRRWAWIQPSPQAELAAIACVPGDEARESARAVYAILAGMAVDERIAFSLRFIEQMALGEAAALCGVSLATLKRRLQRAERAFVAEAERHPALAELLRGGQRWASG
jgi:RNA polymerase sigma-70 factor (ECF subfamily)